MMWISPHPPLSPQGRGLGRGAHSSRGATAMESPKLELPSEARLWWARHANDLSRAAAAGQRLQRVADRSEEHTSELQSQSNLVCRLLLEKKKDSKTHFR